MTNETMSVDTQEALPVEVFASNSYLDYSMYVILERSLPYIGDGLKPVHRRIIYAMNGLNLNHTAKYKKSARTVGDTLGKYHPHGDSACYEAMVLMAQPFSTRAPLVDGQGNWGCQDDPKSFAAMRYTESRLTAYSDLLLAEVDQDTVEWKLNFDGTMKEPEVLPAQLPNILINGSIGIAVGMSTDIPPHNVNEVTKACILTLERAKTTDDDILDIISGPDYPTGGHISTPKSEIRAAYKKGKGKLKLRASYTVGNGSIMITSLPFQVQTTKVLVEISAQIEEKKLPMVVDWKDLGDEKDPVQIELILKNGKVDADAVMSHLFATTSLEHGHRINFNMIGLNKKPQTKTLPDVIREWCLFRQDVFERKKRFRLRKVEARLHIVEGLLVAYDNLDEVIRIIREEEHPKTQLMESFSLSDIQANAILDLRLRQLAKLEEHLLLDELQALNTERDSIINLLADDQKVKRAVVSELKVALKKHSSERRTHYIDAAPAEALSDDIITPPTNTTVIMSKNNWIRTAKGHGVDTSSLNYKAGDSFGFILETRTNIPTLIMSKMGRFFALDTSQLPNAKGVGEPLSTKASFAPGDEVHAMLPYFNDKMLLITTTKGKGFRVPISSLDTRAKKGKHVFNVTDGDAALLPIIIDKQDKLVLLSQFGRMSIIDIDQVNESNKSQGVKLIQIRDTEFASGQDSLIAVLPIHSGDSFTLTVGQRDFKVTPEKQEPYLFQRGRKGGVIEQKSKRELPMSLKI
jgi:topoisomerase-4 subunit A